MKSSASSVLFAALAMVLAALPVCAQSVDRRPPLAAVFDAQPGTNTLMLVRDAVRAWRSAGHPHERVVIRLSRGDYWLTAPLALAAPDGNATWVARDPDRTVISGGQRLAGFALDSAGVWHAQTGLQFEQLYVNGRRAIRARAPAEGFFPVSSVTQAELPEGRARITIKVPAAALAALPADVAALRQVQMLVFHKWDTSRYSLSAFDAAAGTISVEGRRLQTWNPWNDQSRFILENAPLMLAQPGTWFLGRSGVLDYIPLPGERRDTAEVIAPALEQFLVIHGAADIHFQGLRFCHAGYRLPPAGCPPVQAAAQIGAAIELDDVRNVSFEQTRVAHTGNYGIWFRQGCRDCRVQHCLFEDLGAGGLRIGETVIRDDAAGATGGITIDNNIIRRCGRVHPSAVGLWIGQSAGNRITHNDISDTFYTGISVGWTWGYGRSLAVSNVIGFNRIHEIGQGVLSDLGGIYTLGVSPGSVQVGNVIYNVRACDYGGWGIYPDEGSSGWRIESNLVWNCTCVRPRSGGGFHQHYGAANFIANNLFAFSSGPPLQATRVEDHQAFIFEHNLVVSSNSAFFTGPWDKLLYASRSNCFVGIASPAPLFPTGDLASWQQAGHEAGSILTNLEFRGRWPDVALSPHAPAFAVGFAMFDSKQAGVYGDHAWLRLAGK